ncbi:MAG: SDR family oxidoreductase [Chloroflexota bacterium]|nr:SDR family oxidoreductase [Dehalococcoidia bacterium]MDW8253203.1 SDR family oxidoreductase [Chloroflexota bacterium]
MRIVISGGAGFIGSHLADLCLARGHSVVVIDNLITGRRANIEHLLGRPDFQFLERDVNDEHPDIEGDLYLHLASPASPVGYSRYPIETMLTNSLGTQRLLDLARRDGARFLFASTSEAYGDPLVHPQPETYWGNVNPVGPRACYDESKRYGEALTITYVRQYQLDARIVRIFNTYGPRNDPNDGRIVPNFITQALRGEPITVYGSGLQTRSFCYVTDLVDGIWRAATLPGLAGEVINLGNPLEYAVIDLARLIKELAASPSAIVHLPAREEEIARRRPDITKAGRLLGWTPRVGIEDGLRQTIEWFRLELGLLASRDRVVEPA